MTYFLWGCTYFRLRIEPLFGPFIVFTARIKQHNTEEMTAFYSGSNNLTLRRSNNLMLTNHRGLQSQPHTVKEASLLSWESSSSVLNMQQLGRVTLFCWESNSPLLNMQQPYTGKVTLLSWKSNKLCWICHSLILGNELSYAENPTTQPRDEYATILYRRK